MTPVVLVHGGSFAAIITGIAGAEDMPDGRTGCESAMLGG